MTNMVERWPGGKRKANPKRAHAGANNIRKRFELHWDAMVAYGVDARWGTVLGRLYLEGLLTSTQASAGILYAEIAGRYDRYFGVTRRTPKSQSYQRSFGGADETVQRHIQDGTVRSYERRAKAARKRWERLQNRIPSDHARSIVENVCLHEIDIPRSMVGDLAAILSSIAAAFGNHDMVGPAPRRAPAPKKAVAT